MTAVVIVCSVLLTAAAVMALIRAERGPSMLDRTVALDVFTTTLVAFVALEAAYVQRIDTIPVLVVLSLVGFVGSVTIARFAAREPEGEGKVRTREEIALEEAARIDSEQVAAAGDNDPDQHGSAAPGEVR
ncbi:monovalent cation/H+ antiporter complex subunit F [Pengzhenrongella sp.]|jgi:multicomponent Na+:H+ antiporter subunit F|uniref:monovalent cation/H+ antiporter complex subunit F n=1 Tax=Pengzhenrongella sp. TaxID=2888820 RepID=UPI002F9529C9